MLLSVKDNSSLKGSLGNQTWFLWYCCEKPLLEPLSLRV